MHLEETPKNILVAGFCVNCLLCASGTKLQYDRQERSTDPFYVAILVLAIYAGLIYFIRSRAVQDSVQLY